MAAGRQILLKFLLVFILLSNVNSQKGVIDLDEDNWQQMLENEWMVEL